MLKKTTSYLRDNVYHLIGLGVLLAIYITSNFVPPLSEYQDRINTILVILFYLLMGWILSRIINYAFYVTLEKKYQMGKEDDIYERGMQTKLRYLQAIANIIIWLIVIALIFFLFDKLRAIGSSMLISAGIGGVVLGFAAQKSIANLIAGFQVAFTQPIRINDALFIEGQWGWVEEITLTYVVVKIWDKRRLVLPISYFVEQPFQNWTKYSADMFGTVFLYTDYRVPVDKLRKKLNTILKNHKLWDGKVGIIQVTNSTESSVELRILVSARNSPEAFDLRCDVREQLIKYLEKYHPQSLPVTRAEIKNQ